MTHTMMFDGTLTGEERVPPLGEVWSRLVRGLISFLRSELRSGGGLPPGDDDGADGPATLQAAMEVSALPGLDKAYVAKSFPPTYEPLLKPEPEPTQPPDQPDPPPSGSGYLDEEKRTWPIVLVALLMRRLFPEGFPSQTR